MKTDPSIQHKIISGTTVSETLLNELKEEIDQLQKKTSRTPGLAVILVGDDPASQTYVNNKKKACAKIGIRSSEYHLAANTAQEELIHLIKTLNQQPDIHGILLQVPLPAHLDEQKLLALIDPTKDVDGFHPMNVGKLLLGLDTFKSCTPYGIMELLTRYQIEVEKKHVVIVGRSNIIGKPMAAMLIQKEKGANATVTICHSGTSDLAYFTRQADILIVGIGKPLFIKADHIREGVVILDVGTNRIADPSSEKGSRLVGDVDFDSVINKVSKITPVPGGIGPMTIAMLMKNTVKAFKKTLEYQIT